MKVEMFKQKTFQHRIKFNQKFSKKDDKIKFVEFHVTQNYFQIVFKHFFFEKVQVEF